jgi:hypothetical protein
MPTTNNTYNEAFPTTVLHLKAEQREGVKMLTPKCVGFAKTFM